MREDLDEIAKECQKILNTEYTQKLDELYGMGGTSGGARPKIMTRIHDEEKAHMLTAAALLELDFEQPPLDYHELMKLTKILTMNQEGDVENMYRRMCFNVFAHNRDDHSKNFTYIMKQQTDGGSHRPMT